MARTRQTVDPPSRPQFYKAKFVDHAGLDATRVWWSDAQTPIPDNFSEHPLFSFQVYSTISLHLEDIEEPSAKRARSRQGGESVDHSRLQELVHYLAGDPETEGVQPVFDIYPPQPDAFAAVEHQKREIAHRKARSGDASTFLIPRVIRHTYDRRRSGFLIVLTSDSFSEMDEG